MLVFKFGGASVKDANAIKKIPIILNDFEGKMFIPNFLNYNGGAFLLAQWWNKNYAGYQKK